MKLNLGASEYKPKFGGPSQGTQQGGYNPNMQSPYGYNNQMYNPYGGMYQGQNMYGQQNMMYGQGGQYYDPNMVNPMMMDPNAYQGQMGQMGQNPYYQPQQQKVEVKPTGGLIGMGGKAKKAAAPTTTTQPQSTQPIQQNKPLQPQQPKPMTTTNQDQKKPLVTDKKPTANIVNKPKTRQAEPSSVSNQVSEITKKTAEIEISSKSEVTLETDSKEGTMIEIDMVRKPVTIVFIGHVDAGKSTISGSILYKTGQIDERTIDKYKREAKANNRESWFMAYIMDVNDEEKERGKTVEVGKAFFETPNKRFTILDAPGHASFVPNMLQGACQADYAGLVISAKNGEFEAGFEKDGRTKEHALLAKSLGVHKLVVIINKMDEETVKWSKDRYDQIKADLSVYLKNCGYNLEKHVYWVPMSGLTGEGLTEPVSQHRCSWYQGPTLLEVLDELETPPRTENGPVRVPILDRYKEQGVYLLGKIESGTVKYGATYTLMPTKTQFEVAWLFDTEERGVPYARPGESIRIKVKGIESEAEISRGSVICSNDDLCPIFNTFMAEIQVLELPEKKQIMANGYQCILHMHTIIEECTIDLVGEIDRKTKTEKKVKFIRSLTRAKVVIKTSNSLCGEKFEKFATLGRFTLRDEGK
jgi:peptide chain release factor subunit 3